MNQRKMANKGVIGDFLSGLATNEIPKLTPLAQAGGQALIGSRFGGGLGGQILGGAAAPIIGSLVNTGAGILGGLLKGLPFKKGGVMTPQMMYMKPMKGRKVTKKAKKPKRKAMKK